MDKNAIPGTTEIAVALGATNSLWHEIEAHATKSCAGLVGEWNYGGAKFGWSYRLKVKKRVIIYLLPRDGYFKVAFVFGDKAVDAICGDDIGQSIKDELTCAKKYAEGRGIRLDVKNSAIIGDICKLIHIKQHV